MSDIQALQKENAAQASKQESPQELEQGNKNCIDNYQTLCYNKLLPYPPYNH